jgi:hypothetical protein
MVGCRSSELLPRRPERRLHAVVGGGIAAARPTATVSSASPALLAVVV